MLRWSAIDAAIAEYVSAFKSPVWAITAIVTSTRSVDVQIDHFYLRW